MVEHALKYSLGNLSLVIDRQNRATPFMVYFKGSEREYSATYECAVDTGMLACDDDYHGLIQNQYDWLEGKRELVEEFDAEFFCHDED